MGSGPCTDGTSSPPRSNMRATWSRGIVMQSGSSTGHDDVPMTTVCRWGSTMSPSDGWSRRLTTRSTLRPATATMTPAVGTTGTSRPASAAIFPAHGPVALTTTSASIRRRSPVRRSRTMAPSTRGAPEDEVLDLRVRHGPRAIGGGRGEKRQAEMERVEDAVGDLERRENAIAQCRLEVSRLRARQVTDRDAGPRAGLLERLAIGETGVVDGHEDAAVELEDLAGDARQDVALRDAFDRGLRVLDRVPSPRMEQAVVAAGRSGGDLAALDQCHGDASECEVVGGGGARRTGADDERRRVAPKVRPRLKRCDAHDPSAPTHAGGRGAQCAGRKGVQIGREQLGMLPTDELHERRADRGLVDDRTPRDHGAERDDADQPVVAGGPGERRARHAEDLDVRRAGAPPR